MSFASQLLCFNPKKVKSAESSALDCVALERIAQRAIVDERIRRSSSLLSFPSSGLSSSTTTTDASPALLSTASSDIPHLWKGAQEPGGSTRGLLNDSNMNFEIAFPDKEAKSKVQFVRPEAKTTSPPSRSEVASEIASEAASEAASESKQSPSANSETHVINVPIEPGLDLDFQLDSDVDLNVDTDDDSHSSDEPLRSKSAQPSPVEETEEKVTQKLLPSQLSIRLSSDQLPSKQTIRKRSHSFSDDFSSCSTDLSRFSLAYETDLLGGSYTINVQLPPPHRSHKYRRRELTDVEREWLNKEGIRVSSLIEIDPLFADCQPIDKKIAISSMQTDTPLISEIVFSSSCVKKSQSELHIDEKASSEILFASSRVIAKLIATIHDGGSWKTRFLVLTEQNLLILKQAEDDSVARKIGIDEMKSAVLCNNASVASLPWRMSDRNWASSCSFRRPGRTSTSNSKASSSPSS